MRLWPHVVAHAKRHPYLRGARKDELAIDNVLQGRIMCLLGAGTTHAEARKGASSRSRSLAAYKKLLRAAKLTGLSVSSIIDDRLHDINETEDGENPAPRDDIYSDDGFEDGEDSPKGKRTATVLSGSNTLKSALLQPPRQRSARRWQM